MRDYDQDPIVVYTAGSYAQIKRFYQVHNRNRKSFYILFLVVFIVILSLSFSLVEWTRMPRFYVTVYVIVILEALHRLLIAQGVYYTQKQHKKYESNYRGGRHYHFMEDHFTCAAQDGSYKMMAQSPYDSVQKILETKDALYLYTTPSSVHILPKDGIEHDSATPEELAEFVRRKWAGIPYSNISGEKRDLPPGRAI